MYIYGFNFILFIFYYLFDFMCLTFNLHMLFTFLLFVYLHILVMFILMFKLIWGLYLNANSQFLNDSSIHREGNLWMLAYIHITLI